ncbi:tyrosine-type recombinase/integrase [Herminiimonas arsenitoxidans]|uniref:tyrosine-type recombinase/integrase n=1 Tax=Herminiimonas arsenitoxidans TaxID=1809410 RepID=UPI0009713AD3|nr:tyrosine-type recombinase/integrase [Herminiimonas arsenitoxidans]
MDKVDQYLHAATRENTRKSYQAAVQHFEVEWGGFLPATANSVARYLADYAESLSANTLRQRLAALARWHTDQGFPDPTKAPVVRGVFRGILASHPTQEKQAKPLLLGQLEQVAISLDKAINDAEGTNNRPQALRLKRNKALLLLGFWRGFRSDELTRLTIENITASPGEGMICYLSRTKGDRQYKGTSFKVPALSKLCPVEAYLNWQNAAQLTEGPTFRAIDRWGHVSEKGIHIDSIAPLLRSILHDCGVVSSELYSSHSLRRGLATWAMANGWDIKTLMTYVGWKNMQSALRYIDADNPFIQQQLERRE